MSGAPGPGESDLPTDQASWGGQPGAEEVATALIGALLSGGDDALDAVSQLMLERAHQLITLDGNLPYVEVYIGPEPLSEDARDCLLLLQASQELLISHYSDRFQEVTTYLMQAIMYAVFVAVISTALCDEAVGRRLQARHDEAQDSSSGTAEQDAAGRSAAEWFAPHVRGAAVEPRNLVLASLTARIDASPDLTELALSMREDSMTSLLHDPDEPAAVISTLPQENDPDWALLGAQQLLRAQGNIKAHYQASLERLVDYLGDTFDACLGKAHEVLERYALTPHEMTSVLNDTYTLIDYNLSFD